MLSPVSQDVSQRLGGEADTTQRWSEIEELIEQCKTWHVQIGTPVPECPTGHEKVDGDEHKEAVESSPVHHPTTKRCSGSDSSKTPPLNTSCTAGVASAPDLRVPRYVEGIPTVKR